MNYDLLILLTAAITNLVLGAVVFLRNTKAPDGRAFLGLALAITVWIVTNYYTDHATLFAVNVWADKVAFASGFLTLVASAAFTYYFGSRRSLSRRQWIFYGPLVVVVTSLAVSNLIAQSLTPSANGYSVVPGSLYVIFPVLLVAFFGASIYNLYTTYRATGSALVKTQIKFISFGFTVTFILAVLTNVVLPAVSGDWALAKVGPLLTVFMVGSLTYAIVRHRLFNIRLVIARSVAYALLLITLAGLYGTAIFSISRYIFPNSVTSANQNTLYIVLAVLLAFTFQPLKRFFEQLTDRIFFRDRYDTQELLSQLGQILVNEFQLEGILRQTLTKLSQNLKIRSAQFYIFDHNRVYKVEHYGPLPSKLITVPHLREMHNHITVADELSEGKQLRLMTEYGFRVVMRLRTKEEFVGYLLLGDKLSGDLYTSQDIELLEIFAQELAVAVSNAKAYEEIAHFNVTLQGKVDDATERLQAANRHLKELDKAKDEFISMVSHQLRTPVTGIKGYLSLLLDGDAGSITAQQREFVESASDGAQRMINMVTDLLNVSRMSAGRFVIDRTPVDLHKLVQQEVYQLQRTAQGKHVKLVFAPPKHKLPIMSLDEDKTRQVLMNFIDNAIYYTPKGDVTVSLERVGKRAELRVKDSGIGVPEAARSHLFTKYYRADNAKSERPDGTGLGLYLAKRVIEDQGGSVIFESVEGKGSTFGFAMPLK